MKSVGIVLGIILFVALAFVIAIRTMSQQVADASQSPPYQDHDEIGAIVDVTRGTQANGREGFWPCGSTPEAFDEMEKWAVRNDSDEVKITMRRTHSIGLTAGLKVKILDVGFGKRKVRVLGLMSEGHLYAEDPRTGNECWVVTEALGK